MTHHKIFSTIDIFKKIAHSNNLCSLENPNATMVSDGISIPTEATEMTDLSQRHRLNYIEVEQDEEPNPSQPLMRTKMAATIVRASNHSSHDAIP